MNRKTRTHHYLDIENLCGASDLTSELVAVTFGNHLQATQAAPDDLFTVGVSHHNLEAALFGIRPLRSVCFLNPRSGPDGADLALMESIADSRLDPEVDRVVIGSGDHMFAFALSQLKNRGFVTAAVSRFGSCSRHVLSAAGQVLYLPPNQSLFTSRSQEIV